MFLNTSAVPEKRRHTRAEVSWPVVILTSQGATVAETKNIGASGAFILCRAQLQPKEKIKVFVMAPNRNSLQISAEVAWSNPLGSEEDTPPCGVGLRFTRVAPSDRQFLREVIAQHYERKIGRIAEQK
jgi:Tfp pilus assembly protein PilZ